MIIKYEVLPCLSYRQQLSIRQTATLLYNSNKTIKSSDSQSIMNEECVLSTKIYYITDFTKSNLEFFKSRLIRAVNSESCLQLRTTTTNFIWVNLRMDSHSVTEVSKVFINIQLNSKIMADKLFRVKKLLCKWIQKQASLNIL